MIAQGDALAVELNAIMRDKQVDGEMATGEVTSAGDVPSLVLDAARNFGADLIVMGTRGRRGVQRLILGSVAERCVRQATVPVLLIPAAAIAARTQ
jgi:nucleotide-binding universal stress UspA family protein